MRPETLAAATRECRRLRPDVATGLAPIRWGTGFMLGSKRFGPFGRNAPTAFGHTGLTNIAVWADPQRALSVGIVSSGKPAHILRPRGTAPFWTGSRAEIPAGELFRSRRPVNVSAWVSRCCSNNSTRCGRCCIGRVSCSDSTPSRRPESAPGGRRRRLPLTNQPSRSAASAASRSAGVGSSGVGVKPASMISWRIRMTARKEIPQPLEAPRSRGHRRRRPTQGPITRHCAGSRRDDRNSRLPPG